MSLISGLQSTSQAWYDSLFHLLFYHSDMQQYAMVT